MNKWLKSVVVSGLLLMSGCGYLSSGKWEEDPKNWKRAMGYEKPADAVVLHSWYWRSSRWTKEETFFFQLDWNKALFNRIVANNKMVMAQSGSASTDSDEGLNVHEPVSPAFVEFCSEKPSWFVPKTLAEYEAWQTEGARNIWLFRDPDGKTFFLYGCQQ